MLKKIKNRLRQSASFIKRDEPALLTFLFHSIFCNKSEINRHHIDPQQHITLDTYRWFLEYFLEAGYQFISPENLQQGLNPEGRYILSTFDDGYYNNQHVLPLLKEYKTPALFFITTDNVSNNQCFWWDVVYRELSQRGLGRKEISTAQRSYKKLNHDQIIERLKNEFGDNAFTPYSDIDRPFTPEELKEFAAQDFVFIGNHTSNHYILDQYPANIQQQQLSNCQEELHKILNQDIQVVAYPNGNYNSDTLSVAANMGFDYGITVDKRKNYLPLKSADKLRLGRFVLWGNAPLKMQCDIFRSDMAKRT